MNIKPISISLSPNTERDDILLAFKLIFQPWKWKRGKQIKEFEDAFKDYLGVRYAVSFNSGRSALMAILNALDLKEGEVLLQAFTCNAASNPVMWSGLIPVYVDVNDGTFNMDAEDLKRKITKKSKAVIIQHTFGKPAEIDKISEICEMNNLILIEDCAHSLGATHKNQKVGTFGRVSFFSFSRDKVISSFMEEWRRQTIPKLPKNFRDFRKNSIILSTAGFSSNFCTPF
jgi:dTDP-4-amino-4,6-dideoxygalactose transaminase